MINDLRIPQPPYGDGPNDRPKTTLIIAPSHDAARALQRSYFAQVGCHVMVKAWGQVPGHRADRVIVLPFNPASATEQRVFELALHESFPCRVNPGGELIIL